VITTQQRQRSYGVYFPGATKVSRIVENDCSICSDKRHIYTFADNAWFHSYSTDFFVYLHSPICFKSKNLKSFFHYCTILYCTSATANKRISVLFCSDLEKKPRTSELRFRMRSRKERRIASPSKRAQKLCSRMQKHLSTFDVKGYALSTDIQWRIIPLESSYLAFSNGYSHIARQS